MRHFSFCLGAVRHPWRCLLVAAWLLAVAVAPAQAQQLADFAYSDSLTQALEHQHRWRELDSVGRTALLLGNDYPALRRRLGAAALATQHPAAAVRHYGRALHENPLDSTARYGLATAYLELNQPGAAALLAAGLPDSTSRALHLTAPRAVTGVEVEASGQQTTSTHRGTAGYLRLGVSSRLSPGLGLTQNVSYFGQTIQLPDRRRPLPPPGPFPPPPPPPGIFYPVRQLQYHALLRVQLSPEWRVLLGYHYLNSDFGQLVSAPGHMGYAALSYTRPYWAAQAGVFRGTLTDTARMQTDLRLTVYPLGSLRLYAYGRGSVVHSSGRSYPNGLLGAGGRLSPRFWVEAYGGTGQVPVLAELDGTYVYNLLDPLRRHAGANLLILLSRPWSLRLSYGAEQRRDAIDGRYYELYSLSTSLAWTW